MKIAEYSTEQLRKMIERLESFQGTRNARSYDRRYIRAYREQLRQKESQE